MITEVYTLHAALAAALLWLALLWRQDVRFLPGKRTSSLLAALALLFGLGLAHHRATLLLLPALLVFLAWQARPAIGVGGRSRCWPCWPWRRCCSTSTCRCERRPAPT